MVLEAGGKRKQRRHWRNKPHLPECGCLKLAVLSATSLVEPRARVAPPPVWRQEACSLG